MLLDLERLLSVYALQPSGVLHLGAHQGEEAPAYAACGISRAVWVEGNPELVPALQSALEPYGHEVIQGLIAERAGEPATFFVTNNGQSSSVLPLGTHQTHHPDVYVTHELQLTTTTVDALAEEHDFEGLDFMNIDLQGAELPALRGSETTLSHVDYIYTEVNREDVYQGATLIAELDQFLLQRGFRRVVTRWTDAGWGDAFYARPRITLARHLLGWVRFRQPLLRVRTRVRTVAIVLAARGRRLARRL